MSDKPTNTAPSTKTSTVVEEPTVKESAPIVKEQPKPTPKPAPVAPAHPSTTAIKQGLEAYVAAIKAPGANRTPEDFINIQRGLRVAILNGVSVKDATVGAKNIHLTLEYIKTIDDGPFEPQLLFRNFNNTKFLNARQSGEYQLILSALTTLAKADNRSNAARTIDWEVFNRRMEPVNREVIVRNFRNAFGL